MKIAIRAVGNHNASLLPLLKYPEVEIVFYADADASKWGQHADVPVVPAGEAYMLYHAGRIDKFFLSPHLSVARQILEEMHEAGVADSDICIPSVARLAEKHLLTEREISSGSLQPSNWHQIRYLEFHITDSCNLNCSGCIHFSSLVEPGRVVPLAQVRHDLVRLRQIVDHIEVIRILGGEPFLNPEWQAYVEAVRECYPHSDLHIATNGLLVKRLTNADCDFLREHGVNLAITNYRPLWGKESVLAGKLREMGIRFGISAPATDFRSCLQEHGTIDAEFNRASCGAYCFNMHYGRMAPCPIMMYVGDFNKYFGGNYPEDVPIDLDEDMDFESFMRRMHQPMKLCAYCNQNKKFSWSKFAGDKSDWLADA